jgi:energy-coupling factor transport system ATP-binding protein
VGLAGDAGTHPAELPASKQRLLALATVLAREPAVLALDEPTVGLDRHGLEVLHRAVVDSAARGASVVLVTHDVNYARATAHRVLTLGGGSLWEI